VSDQRYADYHSPDLLTHLRSRTVDCYGCFRVEEAADEIERLTDELGRTISDVDCRVIENGRLRAEIERLKAECDDWKQYVERVKKFSELEIERGTSTVFLTQHWPHCEALKTGVPDDCNCPHRI
jgi:hypothetical protein